LAEKEEIITLVDDDGEQFDFVVLDYFRVDELNYAILFPVGKNGLIQHGAESEEDEFGEGLDETGQTDEGEAVIFRVVEGDDGETMLHVIEDEEEWEKVAGVAYERLLAGDDEEEDEEEDEED